MQDKIRHFLSICIDLIYGHFDIQCLQDCQAHHKKTAKQLLHDFKNQQDFKILVIFKSSWFTSQKIWGKNQFVIKYPLIMIHNTYHLTNCDLAVHADKLWLGARNLRYHSHIFFYYVMKCINIVSFWHSQHSQFPSNLCDCRLSPEWTVCPCTRSLCETCSRFLFHDHKCLEDDYTCCIGSIHSILR